MLPRKRGTEPEVEQRGESPNPAPSKKGKASISPCSSTMNPPSKNNMDIDSVNGAGASMVEIDEDLHSRQLAVYGRETMRRLFASDVLISGLQGLGAEIGECQTILFCILANCFSL
jgi:ubiquitin-activating enzyme E1